MDREGVMQKNQIALLSKNIMFLLTSLDDGKNGLNATCLHISEMMHFQTLLFVCYVLFKDKCQGFLQTKHRCLIMILLTYLTLIAMQPYILFYHMFPRQVCQVF